MNLDISICTKKYLFEPSLKFEPYFTISLKIEFSPSWIFQCPFYRSSLFIPTSKQSVTWSLAMNMEQWSYIQQKIGYFIFRGEQFCKHIFLKKFINDKKVFDRFWINVSVENWWTETTFESWKSVTKVYRIQVWIFGQHRHNCQVFFILTRTSKLFQSATSLKQSCEKKWCLKCI